MALSVVQTKFAQIASGTTLSLVLDSTPVSGNLLVATVCASGPITAVTYPWSATPDVSALSARPVAIMSKVAGGSESTTVSFSNSTARSLTLAVVEVNGGSGSWVGFDASAVNSSATAVATLPLGPTGTLAGSDEVAVAAISLSSTKGAAASWSDSFTLVPGSDSVSRGFSGYKILTSTAAVSTSPSWTSTRACEGALATYRFNAVTPIPSGSGSTTVTLTNAGTGTTVKSGTGAGTVTTTTASTGARQSSGSGTTTVTTALAGSGTSVRSGSGTASVTITTTGAGPIAVPTGGGSASFTTALAGTGSTVRSGTGSATVALALAGTGSRSASGSGAATVSITLTAAGTLIPTITPAERTFAIPAERRVFAIAAEDRTHAVPAENRTA